MFIILNQWQTEATEVIPRASSHAKESPSNCFRADNKRSRMQNMHEKTCTECDDLTENMHFVADNIPPILLNMNEIKHKYDTWKEKWCFLFHSFKKKTS